MIAIQYIVCAIFLLKIVWNMGIPFSLARKPIKDETGETSGISLAPFVEFFLLVVLLMLSFFSKGDSLLDNTIKVGLGGGALIVISYLIMALGGVFLGWLRSKGK